MADQNPGKYEPGRNLTGKASAAITSRTFLMITGSADANEGVITVGPAAAAGRICGVADIDTAVGKLVGIHRGNSRVTYVTAAAALTAFQEVEVAAGALATPKASGVAVGYAITACAVGADAQISLY